jgi:CheY-like chemotaxis protein
MVVSAQHPTIMIVDDRSINRFSACEALYSRGWHVLEATDPRNAFSHADHEPSLILARLGLTGPNGGAFAAEIRARDGAMASVPMIALSDASVMDPSPPYSLGYDDILVTPCSPAALVEVAERWRPKDMPLASQRLETVFGHAEIAQMILGLRDLLSTALAERGGADAAGAAHRVAGIAGILGFSELGRDWQSLSEGAADATETTVRRNTRIAIATIDRHLAAH